MPYNLLYESWIPVRREDGSEDTIKPSQIGECENPPVALNAPRPDFNGALIQFLIGLVQTTCPPVTERAWRKWFKKPPTPQDLDKRFEPIMDAFNVDGDGPRFLQDRERAWTKGRKHVPLQDMLFDYEGKEAAKKNRAHFVKPHSIKLISPWAAIALYVYQSNIHHTGGPNHPTLRGKLPATTVILGENLWQTVWLNVIRRNEFERLAGSIHDNQLSDRFPWLEPQTSLNEKKTFREDIDAAQLYWPMPQRILLKPVDEATSNDEKSISYDGFFRVSSGINYQPPWQHPLSPSRNGAVVRLRKRHLTYQGWTIFSGADPDHAYKPALVVQKYFASRTSVVQDYHPRLWVFGFEDDPEKPTQAIIKAYHERIMPLFLVPAKYRPDFEDFAHHLVQDAIKTANGLRKALKRGLFGTYRKKGDKFVWDFPKSVEEATRKSIIADTAARFWQDTEPTFYRLLSKAQAQLKGGNSDLDELREDWWKSDEGGNERDLHHARDLYDEVTGWGTFNTADPRSVTQARRELSRSIPAPPASQKQEADTNLNAEDTDV